MQKITAPDGSSGDWYGCSVALSSTHLVVGAPYDDDLGSSSGSVYVFSVSDSGALFLHKVTANDGSSRDKFGKSVALSSTHLVVGANGDDDLGSVYVYSVSDSGATFLQKVTANDGSSNDYFGTSVALSGTHLVVGASGDDDLGSSSGSVYVFSVTDTGATFLQKVTANDGNSNDYFGCSVGLSGTHLVVGAFNDDSFSGSVYVYSVTDSGATLVQKVKANYDSNGDGFGYSVGLSGTHLVVGAPYYDSYMGSVYVFSVSDSGATLVQKVTANDGSSYDYFGYSVALSGTHLVVGAPEDDSYQGSVYVFSVSDSGATFLQKVTANDGSSNDYFGCSVGLSGTHLVVGAYWDNSLQGSVYLA
eukprot:gene27008-33223_t